MAVIKAAHYGETEARLMLDPIVIDMAKGLADVPRKELVHDGPDGGPRFEFMQAANAQYRDRGGKDGGHIGAVAHALINLLDQGIAPPTKVVKFFASRGSATAWRDEDVAMASVAIHSGDDEAEARQALVDYITGKEVAYLFDNGADWAVERAGKMISLITDIYQDKFEGGKAHEVLAFEADGIVFRLTRTERDA